MTDLIAVGYTLSTVYDDEGQHQEELTVSVHLPCKALRAGWIKRNLQVYDPMILAAIACHARPLLDDDLERMPYLRYLIHRNDNRLFYSLVTDAQLADELEMSQHVVFDAIDRLAKAGPLRLCETKKPRIILIAPIELRSL